MTQYHVVTVTWQWHAFFIIFLNCNYLLIFPRGFQTVQSHKRRACPCLSDFRPSARQCTTTGTSAPITQNALFVAVSRRNDCVDSALAFADLSLRCTFFKKNKRQRGNRITGEGEIRPCLHPSNASLRDKPIWPRCWWVIATGCYFSRLAKLASVIMLCFCFPNVSILDCSV